MGVGGGGQFTQSDQRRIARESWPATLFAVDQLVNRKSKILRFCKEAISDKSNSQGNLGGYKYCVAVQT